MVIVLLETTRTTKQLKQKKSIPHRHREGKTNRDKGRERERERKLLCRSAGRDATREEENTICFFVVSL